VECTRERAPLGCAWSQHGLANTLAHLAEQMRDPVRMA